MNQKRILAIQPMPGIGDMVWHVPHLRALAEVRGNGVLTLLAKPSSHADILLSQEKWVQEIFWLQRPERKSKGLPGLWAGILAKLLDPFQGPLTPEQRSQLQGHVYHDGVLGILRLALWMRRARFDEVWIFHSSAHYLWAAFLAGIPARFGYGHKQLNALLTSPHVLKGPERKGLISERAGHFADHHELPWRAYDTPILLDPEAQKWALKRVAEEKRRLKIAIGIGGTDACRKWPLSYWLAVIRHLLKRHTNIDIFVMGGPKERGEGAELLESFQDEPRVQGIFDANIQESMALLARMTCFVGNETATLNLAANQATPAFGLFGGLVLSHSIHMYAICTNPPGQGIAAIPPQKVMEVLDHFLSTL